MRPVLLEIEAIRVDDGDSFARVCEYLTIEFGAQFYWSRRRFTLDFRGRHTTF